MPQPRGSYSSGPTTWYRAKKTAAVVVPVLTPLAGHTAMRSSPACQAARSAGVSGMNSAPSSTLGPAAPPSPAELEAHTGSQPGYSVSPNSQSTLSPRRTDWPPSLNTFAGPVRAPRSTTVGDAPAGGARSAIAANTATPETRTSTTVRRERHPRRCFRSSIGSSPGRGPGRGPGPRPSVGDAGVEPGKTPEVDGREPRGSGKRARSESGDPDHEVVSGPGISITDPGTVRAPWRWRIRR